MESCRPRDLLLMTRHTLSGWPLTHPVCISLSCRVTQEHIAPNTRPHLSIRKPVSQDCITGGVGQRPRPLPASQGVGLAPQSGKTLTLLHVYVLDWWLQSGWGHCWWVSWGIEGMETSFWKLLTRKVRELIIWPAVFLGKCGNPAIGLTQLLLLMVLEGPLLSGGSQAVCESPGPLNHGSPFLKSVPFFLFPFSPFLWPLLTKLPGPCVGWCLFLLLAVHDGVAGFRGRWLHHSPPSLHDPLFGWLGLLS